MFGGLWGFAGAPTPLERAAVERIQEQEADRQEAIAAAWAAYHADFPPPLEPPADGHDDTIIVNEAKRIVDIATAFLFGEAPGWDLSQGEAAPEDESPDEKWLAECLRVNNWPVFLLDSRTNGGIAGTPYAKTLPPDEAASGHPYPLLQTLDSSCMTIRWDPRDITRVNGYIWQATTLDENGKPQISRQVIRRAGAGWEIVDQHGSIGMGQGGDWVTDATTPWSLPWAPVLHTKNLPRPNEVYGEADLTPNLIRLNQQLNLHYSNDSRVQHYQGHPILYSVGMSGNVDISPDRFNHLPNKDARLDQLAPKLDPASAQTLRKEIQDRIGDESQTPAVTRGKTDSANPSGYALRIQFWPMDQKIAVMRTLYEPWIVEIIRRLFELGGRGPDKIVKLTWPKLLPIDRKEQLQALEIEEELGVTSRATIAKEIGRDWSMEQENIKVERALFPQPTAIQADKPGNQLAKAETGTTPA